jgi:uncharacterized protein YecE (DUF72 family)
MQVFIGTGSFANDDWIGIFYPESVKKTLWLEFYAEHFNTVEINSTFYAVPAQKQMANMITRTKGKIMFCAKLHKSFTHDFTATAKSASEFKFTMQPMLEEGKLGALLAQFPFSFKNTLESRVYLEQLAEWFSGFPIAVEFRHVSWDKIAVYQFLADLDLQPVSLDLPSLPGLPAPVLRHDKMVYLRLHGRNAANWFEGKDAAERHDYLYTRAELEPWVNVLKQVRQSRTYVFFENTTRGQGLENARTFRELLGT